MLATRKKFFDNHPYRVFESTIEAEDPTNSDHPVKYRFYYFQSEKSEGRRTLNIVVPTITGLSFIESNIAVHSAKNGTNCIVAIPVDNPTDVRRPIAELNAMQIRQVIGIRRLIDYATNLPEINPNRVVICGASLGGCAASLALGVETRIKAAVTFVAGGNFPDMLASSENFLARRYRNTRMQIEGVRSVDEYRKLLYNAIKVDPIQFARRRSPRDLSMIVARKDTQVPIKNQIELWQAFQRPTHQLIDCDHVRAILLYHWYQIQSYHFLRNRLFDLEQVTNI